MVENLVSLSLQGYQHLCALGGQRHIPRLDRPPRHLLPFHENPRLLPAPYVNITSFYTPRGGPCSNTRGVGEWYPTPGACALSEPSRPTPAENDLELLKVCIGICDRQPVVFPKPVQVFNGTYIIWLGRVEDLL